MSVCEPQPVIRTGLGGPIAVMMEAVTTIRVLGNGDSFTAGILSVDTDRMSREVRQVRCALVIGWLSTRPRSWT